MKCHAEGGSLFSISMFREMCSKEKINTNSLAMTELVGVANYLLKVLYFREFSLV